MVRHHPSAHRPFLVLAGALALLATARPARAQAACAASSFADYVSLGAAGCTIGDVRISSARIPTGAPASYAARAVVTPFVQALGGATVVGLEFTWTPALTVPDPSRPTANVATWFTTFDATALVGSIVGIRVGDLLGTVVPGTQPATVYIEGTLAAYELGVPSSATQLGRAFLWAGTPCPPGSCDGSQAVQSFAPRTAVTAQASGSTVGPAQTFAQPGVSSTLNGMRVGLLVQSAQTTVPEPGTLALVGVPLVLLAVARRRGRATGG